jgi:hypothetical protein
LTDSCAHCNVEGVPLLACDDDIKSDESTSGSRPRYCNNCMIGRKVRVFWPVNESWYTGVVQEYDVSTGEHLLCYSDGDTEWVRIGENSSVGAASGSTTTAAAGSPPRPEQQQHQARVHYPNPPERGLPRNNDRPPWMGDPSRHRGPAHGYGPPFPPPHGYPPYGGAPMPPGRMHPAAFGMPPGMPIPYPSSSGPPNGSPDSDSRRKTGPKAWTKEEDAILLKIVQGMQMPMKWSVVAQNLHDRTGKQCRERYVNHLNPRLKVTDWNPVEDSTIFHLYNTIGSHWAKMSKVIPGRTDNGIKNRFHNLRRQYEREDEHRLRFSSNQDFPDQIRLDRLRNFPEHLQAKSDKLWDMEAGIGVVAAQSILGTSSGRSQSYFGPFREPSIDEQCGRCGFFVPSVQAGTEICAKTGWCQPCTRVPPHVSSNLLRECLNLRRSQKEEEREVIESWEDIPMEKRVERKIARKPAAPDQPKREEAATGEELTEQEDQPVQAL